MGRFTKVSESAFNNLQTDAGVLLRSFDPANPDFANTDIICATTGGINPTCTPTYSDWAVDVDNAKNGMLEFMHLDGWKCTLGFTAVEMTAESIKLSLGAADIEEGTGKITPRNSLRTEDFSDIWWVGDLTNNGFAAIKLANALSTGGFSLKTTKNGKGELTVTLTGHYSVKTQDTVPMEFYVAEGEAA